MNAHDDHSDEARILQHHAAESISHETAQRLLLGGRPHPAWQHAGAAITLFSAECLLATASCNPRLVIVASIVPALLLLESIRIFMLARHAQRLRGTHVLATLAAASFRPQNILQLMLAPWHAARRIVIHFYFAATAIACIVAPEPDGLGLAIYLVPIFALLFVYWVSSPSLPAPVHDAQRDSEIGHDDIIGALSPPNARDSFRAALRSHASLIIAAICAALGLFAAVAAFAVALADVYSALGPPNSPTSGNTPYVLLGIALLLLIGGIPGAILGGRRIRRVSSERAREASGPEDALFAKFLRGARR